MNEPLTTDASKQLLNKIVGDLTSPLKKHTGFQLWILFIIFSLILGGYAYFIQLRDGLGVTAMHDYSAWGMYIANFVFFVATSLIGMLISSVLGLLKIKWVTPIARIAEMIALAFAMWAGLVIVIDMGRPDRLLNVFIHGRVQAPVVWDVTVVSTYVAISLLLLVIPLIPDMPILQRNMTQAPIWQRTLYKLLSLGWVGNSEQYNLLHKAVRLLLIVIVPVALAIHTVTSWLFAMTLRPGWDSTIFGPYFVTGAFVSGVAALVIAMYVFSVNFRLKEYITELHFDKVGKLLVLVSLVYLYFNLNEFFVPGYKMRRMEGEHLKELFAGHWSGFFWFAQLVALIIPIILLLFKRMRKPLPIFIIAIIMLMGAWFKRFLIVVPTQLHPYLPIQNVPDRFHTYVPSGIEIALTIFPMIGVLLIITIIAKLFPVMPIWEIAEGKGVSREVINGETSEQWNGGKMN